MNYNAVRVREVFFILILSTGLLNHVIIIPMLLESAGRDAWLSVLAATLPFLLFIYIVFYITKNTGQQNIAVWLKERYGKLAAAVVMIPLLIIIFTHSTLTLMDTSIWVGIYFLPDIPNGVISAILVVSFYWLSTKKLRHLAIMSTLVLPLVVMLGFFIMSVNMNQKDTEYLFPLFLNGYMPFVKGIVYSLSGLTEIYVIILIQHQIKEKMKFRQMALLGAFLVGLTIGPLSGAIMEFGPVEARNMSFPAYEEWKLLRIGDFFSRMDFLAMFQWISGAFLRISLLMYILNQFIKAGENKYVLPALFGIIYVITLLPINTFDINKFLYVYFLPGSLIAVSAIAFFLFFLVLINKRRSYNNLEKTKTKQTDVEGT